MFEGFVHERVGTERGGDRPGARRCGASTPAPSRLSAEQGHVAQGGSGPRRALHRDRARPPRLRRQLTPARCRGPPGLRQARDGRRPGEGDGAARLPVVLRGRPRPRGARGLSHGVRPRGAGAQARRPRHRAHLRAVRERRPPRRDGGLPLVLPRPAPGLSRAAHRRGSGVLPPPHDGTRVRASRFDGAPQPVSDEAFAEYLRCFRNPEVIHATCEDYRAGATIDFDLDAADLEAGRRIQCPMLALWGERGRRREVFETWQRWATDVRGRAIACGHFLPEEAPDETLAELTRFFLNT